MSDLPSDSTSPLILTSHHVPTTLNFSTPSANTPSSEKWFVDINNPKRNTNFDTVPVPTNIYDVRGQEAYTHINTTGFQALTSPSAVSGDFLLSSSDADIARVYYPEVEALLLKHTGASRVVFFDHTVRRPVPPEVPESPATRRPVLRAHVDQTPLSAHKRVERHVQPPRPYKRFQLINVWRPILYTVHDYPLAMCDFHTLDVVNDLVPTTLVYPPPAPNGETYSVKHSDNQVWWYWSDMAPDDVLFLKCYDSASRALTQVKASAADVQENELLDVSGLTPHTAFRDEEGVKKGVQRHSIEVRALVFYD